jgi:hypothetical protein
VEEEEALEAEDSSKLSVDEQEQIIEQLKEFANLDNADAPLFIPGRKAQSATESAARGLVGACRARRPRTLVSGRVRLEQLRQHSLPTIFSTLSVFPRHRCNGSAAFPSRGKVNSLSKYWSLKDLATGNALGSNNALNEDAFGDSPEATYTVFPTCSRVVSAPEITDDCPSYPVLGGITIKSTISIERRRSDESGLASSSCSSLCSTTRLSKSASDISGQALEDREREREEGSSDGRSRSWEKLGSGRVEGQTRLCRVRRTRAGGPRGAGKAAVGRKKAKSDLDVSERKEKTTPRYERADWILLDKSSQHQRRPTESRKPAMIQNHGTSRRTLSAHVQTHSVILRSMS